VYDFIVTHTCHAVVTALLATKSILDRVHFVCPTCSSHKLVLSLCYQFFRRPSPHRRPLLCQSMQDCLSLLEKLHHLGHAVSARYKHCLCASREAFEG
jgi:hypothetical protein